MSVLAEYLTKIGNFIGFFTKKDEVSIQILNRTGCKVYSFEEAVNPPWEDIVSEFSPDIIVQDRLATTKEEIEQIRYVTKAKLINIDDVGAGLESADTVINPMVFLWNQYESRKVRIPIYEGSDYMILSPSILEHASSFVFHKKVNNLLLSFGGTDTHFITERILTIVNEIPEKLNVTVNLGPGSRKTEFLERQLSSSFHNVRFLHPSLDLLKEFINTDLVICAGGVMLYELAALGVPSLSVAAEIHEIMNIKYFEMKGTTVSLGYEKNMDPGLVKKKIERIIANSESRLSLSRSGKALLDGRGIERVVKILTDIKI
ncbi:DUF354 domain-containing protein [Leptospira sp. FAT2]|uniref:glycosyltransferase n=1 Tax=Leptospira sanjuanensis TaxID=2879643 RepID=UPI001EE92A85|nr:glycosyltransferase [Leptospira sanjuanensis]MCG6167590.1 DUF354 domain-containing protein [Leptospira sanjuanensis]MCG6193009.1 DUF354 domain-containing protein [Leptospira sanjuanensis]